MKKMAVLALAVVFAVPMMGGDVMAMGADAKKGKRKAMKQCGACHDLTKNRVPKVGPPLWGIYGKKAGQSEGYQYSEAHLSKADAIVWDEATLDAYIQDPKALIPGNKMVYPVPGLKVMKAKHRKWVIEFLKTLK